MSATKALYVHIPFCDEICSYCDFAKVFYNTSLVDHYLDALEKEASHHHGKMETIYIGGGTPSSLSVKQLERLFKILQPFYDEDTKEYTIEANPESLDEKKLALCKHYGINRLSLGVQSFQDHLLKEIERHHHAKMVIDLLDKAKRYIPHLSIDMMYGLPRQTLEDLKADLKMIAHLPITHISYYDLILEEGTKLSHTSFTGIDDEIDEAMNSLIDTTLNHYGFHKYEVSNYALNDHESLHNKAYWHYDNYDALGVGATAKIDDTYIEHSRALMRYMKGEDITHVTHLSLEDTMFNQVMMSLRLVAGLDLSLFEKRYHRSIQDVYPQALSKHLANGNLIIENDHLKTTPSSLKYLNTILLDFLE